MGCARPTGSCSAASLLVWGSPTLVRGLMDEGLGGSMVALRMSAAG